MKKKKRKPVRQKENYVDPPKSKLCMKYKCIDKAEYLLRDHWLCRDHNTRLWWILQYMNVNTYAAACMIWFGNKRTRKVGRKWLKSM